MEVLDLFLQIIRSDERAQPSKVAKFSNHLLTLLEVVNSNDPWDWGRVSANPNIAWKQYRMKTAVTHAD